MLELEVPNSPASPVWRGQGRWLREATAPAPGSGTSKWQSELVTESQICCRRTRARSGALRGGGLGRRPRAPSPSGTRNCAVLTQRTSPSSGSTRSSFQGHELEKEPCPATFPPRAGRRPPPRQGARSACAVLLVRRTSGAEIIQKTTFYSHRSLSGNASETPQTESRVV